LQDQVAALSIQHEQQNDQSQTTNNKRKQLIVLQGNDQSNTYNINAKHCEIVTSKSSSEMRINASNKVESKSHLNKSLFLHNPSFIHIY
jgi:hypothetical protein